MKHTRTQVKEAFSESLSILDRIDILEAIACGPYGSSIAGTGAKGEHKQRVDNEPAHLLSRLDWLMKYWCEGVDKYFDSLKDREHCPGHYFRGGKCRICGRAEE